MRTGKTLIARQIGKLLNAVEPKVVNGPEILDKFVGESEKKVRELFADAEADQASKGDASPLHVIIFDEIDAICKARGTTGGGTGVHDSIVNTLLTKIDGVESLNNILLIGVRPLSCSAHELQYQCANIFVNVPPYPVQSRSVKLRSHPVVSKAWIPERGLCRFYAAHIPSSSASRRSIRAACCPSNRLHFHHLCTTGGSQAVRRQATSGLLLQACISMQPSARVIIIHRSSLSRLYRAGMTTRPDLLDTMYRSS